MWQVANGDVCGARDAALNWEFEYTKLMKDAGFGVGLSNPCVFHNEAGGIDAVIHGDDLTLVGEDRELDWFKGIITSKMRIVEWGRHGVCCEADQRHA